MNLLMFLICVFFVLFMFNSRRRTDNVITLVLVILLLYTFAPVLRPLFKDVGRLIHRQLSGEHVSRSPNNNHNCSN
jgi:hypothetical protein